MSRLCCRAFVSFCSSRFLGLLDGQRFGDGSARFEWVFVKAPAADGFVVELIEQEPRQFLVVDEWEGCFTAEGIDREHVECVQFVLRVIVAQGRQVGGPGGLGLLHQGGWQARQ